MERSLTIQQFHSLNESEIKSLIGYNGHSSEVDEYYTEFLGSLFRNNTLKKYVEDIAQFDTYITRCLKNFINNKSRVKTLDSLSTSTEFYDIYYTSQDATDLKKDIYSFYCFYKKRINSLQRTSDGKRNAELELNILKRMIKQHTPVEIASELGVTVNCVYFYRRRIYAWFKSFQKS